MRTIKFRGKMPQGKWAYGSLIFIDSKKPHISYNNGFIEVKNGTVGQFTGLFDKNGKEIYEGDLLKSPFDNKIIHVIFDVENGAWHLFRDYKYYEVIGNIHDNPELLTQKSE